MPSSLEWRVQCLQGLLFDSPNPIVILRRSQSEADAGRPIHVAYDIRNDLIWIRCDFVEMPHLCKFSVLPVHLVTALVSILLLYQRLGIEYGDHAKIEILGNLPSSSF